MSQFKGAITTLIIMFLLLVIPSFFILENTLTQFVFLKANSEFGELVKEEGGRTAKVATYIDEYAKHGLNIRLTDSLGNPVTSTVRSGETIQIQYEYTFTGIRGEQTYTTTNDVLIRKRN